MFASGRQPNTGTEQAASQVQWSARATASVWCTPARDEPAPRTSAPLLGLDWAATGPLTWQQPQQLSLVSSTCSQGPSFQRLPNQCSHSAHHATSPHSGAAFDSPENHVLAKPSRRVIFTELTQCDTLDKILGLRSSVNYRLNGLRTFQPADIKQGVVENSQKLF